MNRTILLAGALATLVTAACRTNDDHSEDRYARQQAGTVGTAQRNFDDRYDSGGPEAGTREAGYSRTGTAHDAEMARRQAGTAGTAQRDFDDRYDSSGSASGMSNESELARSRAGTAGTSQRNYDDRYDSSGTHSYAQSGTGNSASRTSQGYGGSTGPQTSRTAQRDYDDRSDMTGRQPGAIGLSEASAPRQRDLDAMIAGWPSAAQQAARQMITKYGPPNEATNAMLLWRDNGPWEKTVVHREETDHNFPMPHKDVLEQTITMRVPAENIEDLTRFDGSLVVNRTRGTLTAICDREEMNFAAINLANDIVQGRRSVEQARELIARTATEVQNGQKPELVQRFLFDVPRARTGDPGSRFSTDPNRNSSGVIDANAPQPAGQKPKTPPDETIERDHPNKPKIDEVPDKPGDKVEQKDDLDDPD
jgi:hypothetical protein